MIIILQSQRVSVRAEEAAEAACSTGDFQPIRGQYLGHVITLSQSEAAFSTGDSHTNIGQRTQLTSSDLETLVLFDCMRMNRLELVRLIVVM